MDFEPQEENKLFNGLLYKVSLSSTVSAPENLAAGLRGFGFVSSRGVGVTDVAELCLQSSLQRLFRLYC